MELTGTAMTRESEPTPVVSHLPPEPLDWKSRNAQDGTNQLLRTGILTLVFGAVTATLASTVFGGISPHGPHTNLGWLSLIAAMMSMPFGLLCFALGFAKSMRNRHLASTASRESRSGHSR